MTSSRLSSGGAEIDRGSKVSFKWNGKTVKGFEGDTIVSALAGSGIQLVSRSMKYHRKRGLLTADYWDPNCFVQVGDEPNVRGGHRLIEGGMDVSAQNVWPSLERDVKAANGLVGRFLTPGFYYKTFVRPQFLWPTYQKVLRTFAPGGAIDHQSKPLYFDKRYAHPDVVVAGAGPAGLAAAIAAAESGASVLLVEHDHAVGGHLRWGSDADRAEAARLEEAARAAGVDIMTNATVTGRYNHNWVSINQRSLDASVERLVKARAKVLVVAAGLIERPYVFEGNDTVGVMTAGAARRLINLWGVKPGTTAVAMVANDHGDAAVADLEAAGVRVAKVVDGRNGEFISSAQAKKGMLSSVKLNDGSTVHADLLITAVGWTAPTSLLNMSGDRPSYDATAARFFPTELPLEVLAVGGLVGDGSIAELVEHADGVGKVAGARAISARRQLQAATTRATAVEGPDPVVPAMPAPLGRDPHPELYRSNTHGMVDYSEDVSSKDLVAASKEGYDSIELMKRFTTVTMGPSQGKLETVNAVAVLAEARGETIEQVGTTVWRPPYAPISLGALGGRIFEPDRVSPIHPWHEANGVSTILAGQWIRPDHYGDAQAEVTNVRNNVGIIDVTPLGKLDLRGPDVPKLLNLLYTNKWSKLAIGAVRYGVMCAEDGVVLDDGVTAHLGEDHYLMTTTSSGAAAIWEWAENWLQTERPDWQVHVTPVTTAYASINIAGPKSRELLSRLTDVDLDNEAFGYMRVRTGSIAGVDNCVMWRIGFTGELSYEIHVPSGYALHVWERLMSDGADLGVGPFGLEGQRIMRLEKGHFIVGQDTDGLTKAPTAGIGSLIKLDKDDFVGKTELSTLDVASLPVLVALQPVDGSVVPEEAAQIVLPDSKDIIGRITSSRFSPTLNRSVCLGQVDPAHAAPGNIVTVQLFNGDRIPATVMEHHAHFDPEGARLRG